MEKRNLKCHCSTSLQIAPEDVKSVKFWQTMSGDQRFSVVTKGDEKTKHELKKEIEDFAAQYSPKVSKIN